jgi:hypothetical protein
VVAALVAVVLAVGPWAGPAAADDAGSIPSHDVVIDVDARGDLHVTETTTRVADAGDRPLERWVGTRFPQTGSDRYRIYAVSGVTASRPSGAPVPVAVSVGANFTTIRIGDPQQVVHGEQTHVLRYTVSGAVVRAEMANPGGGLPTPAPPDELSWEATPFPADGPIDRVSVRVTAPHPAVSAECRTGPTGTTGWCAAAAGPTSTFSARHLRRGQDVAVRLTYPAGTVSEPGPVLAPTPPTRVSSPITDQVGALGTDAPRVRAALDRLAETSGVRLFVLFTDVFPDNDEDYTNRTFSRSDRGFRDALLAVGVVEGQVYLSTDDDAFPLSDLLAEDLMQREVRPRVRARDWAGAVVALADGLRAPYEAGDGVAHRRLEQALSLGLSAAGAAVTGAHLLVRRRRPGTARGAWAAGVTRAGVVVTALLALDVVDDPWGRLDSLLVVAAGTLLWSVRDGRRLPVRTAVHGWAVAQGGIVAAWWLQELVRMWARPRMLVISRHDPAMFRAVGHGVYPLYALVTPVLYVLLVALAGAGVWIGCACAGKGGRTRW